MFCNIRRDVTTLVVIFIVSIGFFLSSAQASINDGLIAHYTFDEISGPVIDLVGSYDGTNHGATRGVPGIIGSAFQFDGYNDYVDTLPVNAIPTTSTISFWMYPTTNTNSQGKQVFGSVLNASGGKDGIILNYFPATENVDTFYVEGNQDRGGIIGLSNSSFPLDTWSHLTYTWDSSSGIRLYANGNLTATGNFSTPPSSHDRALMFGKSILSQNLGFDGLIDDVKIWDRALSAAEVNSLQYSSPQREPDNPITNNDTAISHLRRWNGQTQQFDPIPANSITGDVHVLVHGWQSGHDQYVAAQDGQRFWDIDTINGDFANSRFSKLANSLQAANSNAEILLFDWLHDAATDGPGFLGANALKSRANTDTNGEILAEALTNACNLSSTNLHLIGHSHGARVATVAAAELSVTPSQLTLLDSPEIGLPGSNALYSNLHSLTSGSSDIVIDNYFSQLGVRYGNRIGFDGTVDVMLDFDSKPDNSEGDWAHSYPLQWYARSVYTGVGFDWWPPQESPEPNTDGVYLQDWQDDNEHHLAFHADQAVFEYVVQTLEIATNSIEGTVESLLNGFVQLTEASPACWNTTIEIDENDIAIQFDYQFVGEGDGDELGIWLDGELVFLSVGGIAGSDLKSTTIDTSYLDPGFHNLAVALHSTGTADAIIQVGNFQSISAVPEPSTVVMLIAGLIGFLAVRRCSE